MVKLLLSFGADTGLRDNAGCNASQYAHCAGFKDVLFVVGMPPPSKPLVQEVRPAASSCYSRTAC